MTDDLTDDEVLAELRGGIPGIDAPTIETETGGGNG